MMARRLQPGAWLASGDAGAAHGFKQQMAWEHAVSSWGLRPRACPAALVTSCS